jgi:hypothetical protein
MGVAPAGSFGQSLPSDPEADSPSGVVYELPVDRARKDAAPQRDAASSRSDGSESSGSPPGAGGVTAGAIRSENNFGTSSEVPGAPRGGDRARDAVKRVAGVATSSTGPTDGPSDGVVYPLLAALLAVGTGIGAVAGRRTLRNRRGS